MIKTLTFKSHAGFTTSGKPARRTLLAVCQSNDAGIMVSTHEGLVVLDGTLEESLTTLT